MSDIKIAYSMRYEVVSDVCCYSYINMLLCVYKLYCFVHNHQLIIAVIGSWSYSHGGRVPFLMSHRPTYYWISSKSCPWQGCALIMLKLTCQPKPWVLSGWLLLQILGVLFLKNSDILCNFGSIQLCITAFPSLVWELLTWSHSRRSTRCTVESYIFKEVTPVF